MGETIRYHHTRVTLPLHYHHNRITLAKHYYITTIKLTSHYKGASLLPGSGNFPNVTKIWQISKTKLLSGSFIEYEDFHTTWIMQYCHGVMS